MILNYIWVGFFLIAILVALLHVALHGYDGIGVFDAMLQSTFTMAKEGFTISLGLTGVLTLWSGIMKIGENAGAIQILSRWLSPVFSVLFPGVPKGHPASGAMMMNFSANMLGLDNAATPLGLKAMSHLQELNPEKDRASNAQIMFLVLNTSGLTLIPVSIMAVRAQAGAANPADIFLPILMATTFSTLVALITVSIFQKINLLKPRFLLFLVGILSAVAGLIAAIFSAAGDDPVKMENYSKLAAASIIFSIIIAFMLLALRRKVNVYESFIEGAKDGFTTAVKIIPYLVAMLVAIGVFRASGAMDYFVEGIRWCIALFSHKTEVADAMPTALMRPLSAGGSRALMIESWKTFGADSMIGRITATIQGSTETTFYTLAVYYGAVNIRKTRYTVTCGLIADLAGLIAAIFFCYLFFNR